MKTYSIYNTATGEFTGRQIQTIDADVVAAFTPDGCVALIGAHDPMRQRVNLATGKVEPWESPALAAEARQRQLDAAHAQLAELDARQQRALAELAINPNNTAAKERLLTLEAAKEPHRTVIRGVENVRRT